jgi:hypothetical protein
LLPLTRLQPACRESISSRDADHEASESHHRRDRRRADGRARVCAGEPDRYDFGTGHGAGRRRASRRHRHRDLAQSPGGAHRRHHRDRRLHHSVPRAGGIHRRVRAAGVQARRTEDAGDVGRHGDARREAANRGGDRAGDGDRRRHRRDRARRDRSDHLQAGCGERATAQPRPRRDDRADARHPAHRAEQFDDRQPADSNHRRSDLGEPGPGERRRGAGQRPPQFAAALHRGRAAGNDDRDVGRVRRVRAVRGRRRQRHHALGRQYVQRHVPARPDQRRLAHGHAVPWRRQSGCRRADLRVHDRRAGGARSAVVLSRRPLSGRNAVAEPVCAGEHPLRPHDAASAVRRQGHLQPGPRAHRASRI